MQKMEIMINSFKLEKKEMESQVNYLSLSSSLW